MSKKSVIILGNGGHAKVLIDILRLQNRQIVGFTTPTIEVSPYDIPYIGCDNEILKYSPEEIELVNGIGTVSNTKIRKSIFDYFKLNNYSFATIIHPSSIIGSFTKLGEGVQIMAGTIIQPFATISDNTIVNTSASIDHDCYIGGHCHIAPGSVLSGGVVIGEGTHIGAGSTIIQNIKIGRNVLVGAGSLVLHDASDNKKVFGIPAKEVIR